MLAGEVLVEAAQRLAGALDHLLHRELLVAKRSPCRLPSAASRKRCTRFSARTRAGSSDRATAATRATVLLPSADASAADSAMAESVPDVCESEAASMRSMFSAATAREPRCSISRTSLSSQASHTRGPPVDHDLMSDIIEIEQLLARYAVGMTDDVEAVVEVFHHRRHLQRLRRHVRAEGLPHARRRRAEGPVPHRHAGARPRRRRGDRPAAPVLRRPDEPCDAHRLLHRHLPPHGRWLAAAHAVDDLPAAQRCPRRRQGPRPAPAPPPPPRKDSFQAEVRAERRRVEVKPMLPALASRSAAPGDVSLRSTQVVVRVATTWGRSSVVRLPGGAAHTTATALSARFAV